MNTRNKDRGNRRRSATLSVAAIMIAAALMAAGSAVPALATSPPLNNVQVFVSTSSPLQYGYYFSAYNLSGSLVASSESSYPGAAFELPGGSYMLTVSAVYQGSYYCRLCAQPYEKGGTSGASNGSDSATIAPVYIQSSEYGFKVLDVSGPASFTITTRNITDFPTTSATVKVAYANGTAAADVWVSASIVGEWYYWWGPNSTIVTSGQTGSDGVASLVLPSAPAVVSAWKWVAVNATDGRVTAMVSIGGEKVNVTAPWQTTYLGLAATGLLLPPAISLQLTLQPQQLDFWVVPLGGAAMSNSGATVSNGASGVPAQTRQGSDSQYFLPSAIPPLHSVVESNQTGALAIGSPLIEAAIISAATIAALAAGVALLLRRRSSR